MTDYAVIGRYWANTLSEINYAGSEWFVPAPHDGQDCLTREMYIKRLEDQVMMWSDNLYKSTNAKEQANLAKIIEIQQGKLDAYIAAQSAACGIPPVVNENLPATTTKQEEPINPNNWAAVPFIALVAFGLLYVMPKLLGKDKRL